MKNVITSSATRHLDDIYAEGREVTPHVKNGNADSLYDPVIGRFFSPDPFVQAPDFTQNYNRYSYCMNNPVMFSDKDGEFWHIIAGAIIGGIVNWFANGAEPSVYAGSSFSAGFCGSVIAMPSSLGVIGGFSSGFAGGFVNGFSSGLGNGLMQTKSFTKSLGFAFDNGIKQGVSGGVVGGLIGGYSAYMKGNHPLTGQKPYLDISLKNYQNVLQNNPSNCKNATLESIEKMNGGTRTQDDFKKLGDAYLETHPQAHLEEYFENLGFNVEDPSTMPVGTIEDAFRNNYPIVVEDATTLGGHTMTLVRIRQWTSNSPKWIWFADPSKKGLSKFLFDYLFETNGLYIFKL
jgi:RHS repeat-associated protein